MIPGWLTDAPEVVHRRRSETAAGTTVEWPSWVPDDLVARLNRVGISGLWHHQSDAATALWSGRHVALATGTASGKSLAYQLPILAATDGDVPAIDHAVQSRRLTLLAPQRRHTALYLAPTKALAHDQLRACRALGTDTWKVACVDGDSDQTERRYAREVASFLLTNPDMLHHSILPSHGQWSGLLQSLRYVVVDEAHRYWGVFGAHVASVLRRLRRLCARYGSQPVFVCSSATATNAGQAMARLIGVDESEIDVVAEDASRRAQRTVLLWEPSVGLYADTARLLAQSVDVGKQTIAFVPSRAMAELVAVKAQEQVTGAGQIAAYRAGYLASDRRELEHALQTGALNGVAATNALELGIDIAGMDTVLIAGFPDTLASLWQQAGRAGRAGRDVVVVLLAKPDPLDSYLFQHPELIFDAPVEATVLHPANPTIMGPHLCAAAQEEPLTPPDTSWFGDTMPDVADRLANVGLLRRRPQGWFWTKPDRATSGIDLRSMGGRAIQVIDSATGRVVGTVDPAAADRTLFPGAVYVHQGEQWLVEAIDFSCYEALVRSERMGYYTQAQGLSDVRVLTVEERRTAGSGQVCRGGVERLSQVTHYLRRDEATGEVWDETPVEMPARTFTTRAMWWNIPLATAQAAGLQGSKLGAAAHALEHTAIGLLPAFAPCDRWDIGGVSTVLHPDTDCCTIFVHDGQPGGAGFADAGFEVADAWLRAALDRLLTCECETGCPACCVSPKCGNANQMLNKSGAVVIADLLLGNR